MAALHFSSKSSLSLWLFYLSLLFFKQKIIRVFKFICKKHYPTANQTHLHFQVGGESMTSLLNAR